MRLTKYLPALILPLALCPASCSVTKSLTRQNRSSQEIRALGEEVEELERSILSMREEISRLNLETSVQSARSETEEIERVIETYDTDKPTDPATGTPPVMSRTTEKRGVRSTATVDGNTRLDHERRTAGRDSSRTAMERELSETVESSDEVQESIKEEAPPKGSGLSWIQKTLMYCGIAFILYVVAWLILKFCKPRLSGVWTTIKQLLNRLLK